MVDEKQRDVMWIEQQEIRGYGINCAVGYSGQQSRFIVGCTVSGR